MGKEQGTPKLWKKINEIETNIPTAESLGAVKKSGDRMEGPLVFSGNQDGVSTGNGDFASFDTNNLKLTSWQGIGLQTTCPGQEIPTDKYSHYFNTRTGDIGMQGNLHVKKHILLDGVIHLGNGTRFYGNSGGTGITNTAGEARLYCDMVGNTKIEGNLAVGGENLSFPNGGGIVAADGNLYVKTGGYSNWLTNILNEIRVGAVPKADPAENTMLHKPAGSNQLYVNNAAGSGWNPLAMDFSNAASGIYKIGSLQVRVGGFIYVHDAGSVTINYQEAFPNACIGVFLQQQHQGNGWDQLTHTVTGFNGTGFFVSMYPRWAVAVRYIAIGF